MQKVIAVLVRHRRDIIRASFLYAERREVHTTAVMYPVALTTKEFRTRDRPGDEDLVLQPDIKH